jgi:hypothetical protein
MFEGLNAIPWAELSHAYGSVEEVPVWLRQLTSDDEQVRQRAMGRLGGSLETLRSHMSWRIFLHSAL